MYIEKLKTLKESDMLWLEYDHAAAEREAYQKQIKELREEREKAEVMNLLAKMLQNGMKPKELQKLTGLPIALIYEVLFSLPDS